MDFQPRYCCVKFFSCCLAAELMRICYYNIKLYHALQSAQVIYDQPWSTAIFLFNLMHTLHLHKPYTLFFSFFCQNSCFNDTYARWNRSKFTFCKTAPNLKFGTCKWTNKCIGILLVNFWGHKGS